MIKLIVGLGNPGDEYAKTRHNAGVWFISLLAKQGNATLRSQSKFKGMTCSVDLHNHTCRLFFPTTFMNRCGIAVKTIAQFYEIHPEEILIAHDDLDLPTGIIRLKKEGGDGGHNGLHDVINHLHTRDFYRLRIGIGRPSDSKDVIDFVLQKPSRAEHQEIATAIEKALDVMPLLFAGDVQKAMHQLHTV